MDGIINISSLILVAQITENGIELGEFLTKFKVQVDDYAETIERFSTLDFSSPEFKLDDGKTNWDAISEAIGGADEHAMSYFKTMDDGNGTINNSSASVQGMSTHLKATGQAFNFAAVKATLLNTVLNAGIFLVASLAIEGVANAINKYVNHADEAREKSTELSNSWKDNNTSLNDTISQYKELNEKLKDSSLSSEEVKSVKEQLTTIQNNLNQAYGDEADSIDLVNGKYDEQIEKLENLSKKKAQDYIAENSGNVKEDKKYLEKIISGNNTTDMIRYNTNLNDKEEEKQYKEAEKIYKKYFEKYNALSLGYDYYKGTTGLRLNLEGTREDIQTQLSSLFAELNEDYTDNPPEFIQGLKDVITETLNMEDFDTTKIEDAKNNVKTYTEAEVLANTKTRNLYNKSVEAVEAYNNALSEGKGIEKAKQNLDDIKAKVSEAVKGYEGYDIVFNDIFDAIQETDSKIAEKTDTNSDKSTFSNVFNSSDFEDTKQSLLELAKAGELTPYTLSSTKEYKTLLDQTGLTAEQVYKKIMKVAKKSMDISDWQTTLDNSRKNIISLKEMKNALKEDGISAVSGDVISNFPELIGCLESETDLRKGINGLISDYETKAKEAYFNLVQDSESYYSNLKKNESAKLNTASKTINAIVNANKTLVSQLGGAYNVDLKNFKSVAQAKASLEQQLIINSAKAWSKYYKVQLDASKNTAKVVADGNFNSGGTGGSDSIKAYEEASKAQNAATDAANAYNEAINALKNITYDTVLPEITNPSGDTDKASKSATKFSQVIDWCAETISNLTNKITNLNAKLENTSGLEKQIKYYKELLNAQNALVKGYSKTENKYKKQYNKALNKLSKEDRNKVENGTYSIEQFSGKSKGNKKSSAEKRYNNIQDALEARDKYFDAQTETVNAKQQFQEYAEALASIRWENATEKVEKLNSKVSVLDTKMSNVSGYKAKNKVLQEQLDLQKKILTKQEKAYENTQSDANAYYKKISSKYKKNKNSDGTIKTSGVTNQTQLKYIKIYNAYVKQLANETIELAQAQEEYTSAVQEATIARVENIKADYDNKLSLIEAKANELNSEIALSETRGQVTSAEYYKLLGDNSNQRLSELENEKKLLEKQLSSTRAYTDEWYEIKQSVIEVDEAIADETVNAVENINKQIEAMKNLTEAKNDYLSGTVGTLDWLEGLTDEEDYYNEDGGFSDKGLAVAKGKLTKVGLYEQQAKNIQENLEELDKMYANGNSDMSEATYLKQKMELTKDYQDAMTSWYDEQQSLHDMYINNLKKESEALSELIDKKKESWEADKSEYDYKKSISEKTKNITDLEKQKSMLEGSTSEEDKAKLQKINVELEDAQQDLEDTQYEKQLERMEEGLDGLQERFDAIIDKLDEEGAIPSVEEIATIVSKNETNVEDGIKQIIKDAGLDSLLGEKGFEGLNSKANELLTTSTTSITSVIETTNSWLEKIFNKDVGNNGNNGSNSNNSSTSSTTTNTEKNSGTSLFDVVKKQTSSIVQKKVKEFIDSNATKAKKKKTEYGILNQKIYEITNGKILNKANRVKLAKSLGVNDTDGNGDITGVEAQKVVKLLENAGFSNGGIVDVVHKNGDDGLATLKVGEAVLTPVQTDAFLKLADNFTPLNNFMDIIQKPKLPAVQSSTGTATTSIDTINFEFNLPNVVDSDSLIKTIQTDSRVQRTLQNATVGKLNGNTKFGVNRL